MAKKSMIAKAKRTPKHKVQASIQGDLVLVSHAAPGGVIGDLYRYIGPTNAGTSTTDLLAANYGDHTKWADLGNPAAAETQ